MNKETKRKALINITSFLTAINIALFSWNISAQDTKEKPKIGTYIPEIFFHNAQQEYCVLRAELTGKSEAERRERFLKTVDYAYATTNSWSHEYVIAGVDYVDFRFFHFVFFHPCPESESIPESLQQKTRLSVHNLEYLDKSNLVSSIEELERIGVLGTFNRYSTKYSIRDCLILTSVSSIEMAFETYRSLDIVKRKYRLPILDSRLSNKDIYILFSRQCREKESLYQEMISLFDQEGFQTKDLLAPILYPSTKEYESLLPY